MTAAETRAYASYCRRMANSPAGTVVTETSGRGEERRRPMTDAERDQWRKLADEADAHLRRELVEESGDVADRPVSPTDDEPSLL